MKAEGLDVERATYEFLEHLKANGCSPHTVRSYRCDLGKLQRFLVGKMGDVGDVRARELARFLNWWATVAAPELVTEAEYDRLLSVTAASREALGGRDRVIFMLLAGTGVRASEVAGLDVKDGASKIPVPVPLEIWLERWLNIRVGVNDLSCLGEGVSGAVYPRERRLDISQSLQYVDGAYRFTLAHEVGHLALHKYSRAGPFTEGSDSLETQPDSRISRLETQANRFAGYVLMPWPALFRELVCVFRMVKVDPVQHLERLQSVFHL